VSSWDGDIVNESYKLTDAQIVRLLAMTECLRDTINMQQVAEIKQAIKEGDDLSAIAFWSEFTEEEQTALWVAPKYGGIFTTDERKALRP